VALQLRIGPADPLAERDQGVAVAMGGGDIIEKGPDTQAGEGRSRVSMNITGVRHGTFRGSRCRATLKRARFERLDADGRVWDRGRNPLINQVVPVWLEPYTPAVPN
jgi:hypothetical protein